MAAFNVDAWLEANQPWSVILKGRRYPAAPVSVLSVLAFQQKVDAMKSTGDAAGYPAAVAELLREAFPYRWQMLLPWVGDPVRRILALGADAQQAVLGDFFAWTGRRWRGAMTTTAGNASASKTPPRPTVGMENGVRSPSP